MSAGEQLPRVEPEKDGTVVVRLSTVAARQLALRLLHAAAQADRKAG